MIHFLFQTLLEKFDFKDEELTNSTIYEFRKYRLEIQKICIQGNYPSPQPSLIQFVG